nr:PREDICTED: myb-like protein X [Megachile rotundata]
MRRWHEKWGRLGEATRKAEKDAGIVESKRRQWVQNARQGGGEYDGEDPRKINGQLKESERAQKEKKEEERMQSGPKGEGKKRGRQEEQGKEDKMRAKGRRIREEEEEEELARSLMEAAEAVEEAEASMCQLEKDFEWGEAEMQELPPPTTSSTPTPGMEKELEMGNRASEDKEKERATNGKRRATAPIIVEDTRLDHGSGKATIRKVEMLQPVIKIMRLRTDEGKVKRGEANTGDRKGETVTTGMKQDEEERGEEVILIKYPKEDIGYWGAIKWLKLVVGEYAENFQEIRDTRKGDILIAIKNGKGRENSRECAGKINREGEGRWVARGHSDTVEVAIRITDPDLDGEELIKAYKESRLSELVKSGDVKFRCIRGPEGTCHRTAYLDCTREAAKKLVQEKQIRTKWQELRPFFPRKKSSGDEKSRRQEGKENRGAGKQGGKGNSEAGAEWQAKPGTSQLNKGKPRKRGQPKCNNEAKRDKLLNTKPLKLLKSNNTKHLKHQTETNTKTP